MVQKFEIETDPSRRYVQVSCFGQWDSETIPPFKEAIDKALAGMERAGVPLGANLTLFDLRGQAVQSQEIAGHIQKMVGIYSVRSTRVAVVVSDSPLHRIQIKRVSSEAPRQFFIDKDEAFDWLMQAA